MHTIVSRHPGAVAWIRRRVQADALQVLPHLEPGFSPAPGDHVLGVLPLPWIERIERAGAACWVLEVELPPGLRGVELSEQQLDALGARLVRYAVRALEVHA